VKVGLGIFLFRVEDGLISRVFFFKGYLKELPLEFFFFVYLGLDVDCYWGWRLDVLLFFS
jgi:hypothetical protein